MKNGDGKTDTDDAEYPATCEVRRWVVFAPGYHRDSLYTPAMTERVPKNFVRLKGYIVPAVKLGHDNKQRLQKRLKESLGFPNLGDFKAVTDEGGGRFAVWLTNVPTAIGAAINAGRLRSGSVELIPRCEDPDDPAKTIEGPIITAVALLGEEAPAVKGFARPHAVFADGRSVPPSSDPTPWLEAMSDVMSAGFSDAYEPGVVRIRGRDYQTQTLCFSEMQPMLTAEQLLGLGLKPDQVEQILEMQSKGSAGGDGSELPPGIEGAGVLPAVDGPPPAGAPPGGAPPEMPLPETAPGGKPPMGADKDKMSADDQRMMSADVVKRLAAMEKRMSDADAAKEKACMSAFSDRVDLVLHANRHRITPNRMKHDRAAGIRCFTHKLFGDVTGSAERAFAAWRSEIETRPEASKFSDTVADNVTPTGRDASTPLLKKWLRPDGVLGRHSPQAARAARNRLAGK